MALRPVLPADQHKDLPEWLEYHKWLGVSQFCEDTAQSVVGI